MPHFNKKAVHPVWRTQPNRSAHPTQQYAHCKRTVSVAQADDGRSTAVRRA